MSGGPHSHPRTPAHEDSRAQVPLARGRCVFMRAVELHDSEADPTTTAVRFAIFLVLASILLYVAGSMIAPATIPRMSVLPKPHAGPGWVGECGNTVTPDWSERDGFWQYVEWSTLVGCL